MSAIQAARRAQRPTIMRSVPAGIRIATLAAAIVAVTHHAAAVRAQDDRAEQARAAGGVAADEYADRIEAAPPGRGAGTRAGGHAGARARIAPPPPIGQADLQRALHGARGDVEACLREGALAGTRATLTARVRIDPARRLTIAINLRPRDAATRACAEIAVRRWVQPVQSLPISRPLGASMRVDHAGGVIVPPPPPPPHFPPPPPPPPPPGQYDEAQVHAALDAMRTSILECISDLSAGIAGTVTLRVSVRPDGSLTLMGVTLPSGVRGPGSLGCLGSRVAWLRVPPPPGERLVVHHLQLGR